MQPGYGLRATGYGKNGVRTLPLRPSSIVGGPVLRVSVSRGEYQTGTLLVWPSPVARSRLPRVSVP